MLKRYTLYLCSAVCMAGPVVLDPAGQSRTGHTTLDHAANGVDVVNIARPNANGVSHNTYIKFNVPTQGLILNNSGSDARTELAGYIYGNENVKNGQATLILNEVTGTNRTQMNGYLEVAGKAADVIVANPNGISINGGGFINIPKATLTTGKVSMEEGRPTFEVRKGDIAISGKGLDASTTDRLALYTRAIKLNAKLHAKALDVATGINRIDSNGEITVLEEDGTPSVEFSIDSTVLGGIYADTIRLTGTQKGVGVNLPGEILVQDKLQLSSDGKIVVGKAVSGDSINIESRHGLVEIEGGIHGENVALSSAKKIRNRGKVGANKTLHLSTKELRNEGLIASGVDGSFAAAGEGTMRLEAEQTLENLGTLFASGDLEIESNEIVNDGAIVSRATAKLSGSMLVNNQTIYAKEAISLQLTQLLQNFKEIYTQGTLRIGEEAKPVSRLENITGSIVSEGMMSLAANEIRNEGKTKIDYDVMYHNMITDTLVSADEKRRWIQHRAGFYKFGDENFYRVNRQLRAYGLLDKVIEVYGSAPHRVGSSTLGDDDESFAVRWTEFETVVQNRSTTIPALISSGETMSLKAECLSNIDATISAAEDIYWEIDTLDNTPTGKDIDLYRTINTVSWYFIDNDWDSDDDTALKIHYRNVKEGKVHIGGSSRILAGGTIIATGGVLNNGSSLGGIIESNAPNPWESGYFHGDAARFEITLPQGSGGLFIVNTRPDGPLIETNPLYTDYNNFVSSEYMLTRLGYNAMEQTRRLGDALYETQLIRDAVMAQTGRRFIVDTDSDNVQYATLMENGVRYAKKHGLKVGEHLDDEARKNLEEDMVWLEERTVNGQKVLVPVLYLAGGRTRDAGGALISAQTVALSLEETLQSSGRVAAEEGVYIAANRVVNDHGAIISGGIISVNTSEDIENLSGSIRGSDVVLKSREGSIINRTLHQDVGSDGYTFTVVDTAAEITAQNGLLLMEAAKNIEIGAGSVEGKRAVALQAGEDIVVDSIARREDFLMAHENGYTQQKKRTYTTGMLRSDGLLQLEAGNDIYLEAANLKAESVVLAAGNKIDLTAVVESEYRFEHNANSDILGSNSTTEMLLRQQVMGSSIDASNIYINGTNGVALESVMLTAEEGIGIISEYGGASFGTKAYTNASLKLHEESMLGGLFEEYALSENSSTLLAGTTAEAQNRIAVNGKNIDMEAAVLSVQNGLLLLEAEENIRVRSGLERFESRFVEEKRGLSFGMDGGRITFAEEEKFQNESVAIRNRASLLNARNLLLKSGKDTTVTASHIMAENVKVDAAGDFNLYADKDVTYYSEAHSTKETGVEFTLNSREASFFAGYWEEAAGMHVTRSDVASATLQGRSVNIDAENTTIKGSKIAGDSIVIASQNIHIVSDSARVKSESYSRSARAGVEVGVRQHLSDVIDAVNAVGEAKDTTAKASRTLQAYDALVSFARHPVSVSVAAVYESSETDLLGESTESVASSIVAENALVLSAVHMIEVGGSDVLSLGKLEVEAESMNLYAGKGSYSQFLRSGQERTSMRLYASGFGETTASYSQTVLRTEGVVYRNSSFGAGKMAIAVSDDMTLEGANIDTESLVLGIGGDLKVETLQDRQNISGNSVGVTTTIGLSIPTLVSGVSVNAGKTEGERRWAEKQSGINGTEDVSINVSGGTSLTGAYITNMDEYGRDGGNLVFKTGALSISDIYDIDSYSSTMAGAGIGSIEQKPAISTLSYGSETCNSAQTNRATIGHGAIVAEHTAAIPNRDVNKRQERTKEESSSTELYISDKTLQLAAAPIQSIAQLDQNLKDVGLAAHVEIVENLPSESKVGDGEGDMVDNTIGVLLDTLGDKTAGILPSVANDGGYITQLAVNLFGDNRGIVVLRDKSVFEALHLRERKEGEKPSEWDYEKVIGSDGSVVYRTNPDKKVVLGNRPEIIENKPSKIEAYKIYFPEEAVKAVGLNHMFTNGMNNSVDEALANQQEQEGLPDAAYLNYNQTHGVLGDLLLEVALEKATIMFDKVPGVLTMGYIINGSARQTGEVLAELSRINKGNIRIAAHSQGTDQTYLGLQQHKDEIAKDLWENPDSVFSLQNSGAPVSSEAVADLVVNGLYGGEKALKNRFATDSVEDVFRSQVNPGDPVGVLGGNFGGVNSNAPITSALFWQQMGYVLTRGVPTLSHGKTGKPPSTHSGYACSLGCGEQEITVKKDEYYDVATGQGVPIENYYLNIVHVDPNRANVGKMTKESEAENPVKP